jgi:hypothetical protein
MGGFWVASFLDLCLGMKGDIDGNRQNDSPLTEGF